MESPLHCHASIAWSGNWDRGRMAIAISYCFYIFFTGPWATSSSSSWHWLTCIYFCGRWEWPQSPTFPLWDNASPASPPAQDRLRLSKWNLGHQHLNHMLQSLVHQHFPLRILGLLQLLKQACRLTHPVWWDWSTKCSNLTNWLVSLFVHHLWHQGGNGILPNQSPSSLVYHNCDPVLLFRQTILIIGLRLTRDVQLFDITMRIFIFIFSGELLK